MVQVFYFSITHDALSTIIIKPCPVIRIKVVCSCPVEDDRYAGVLS